MVEINEGHRRSPATRPWSPCSRVPELRAWSVDPTAGTVRLGAGVTYAELARPPLADLLPALGQAARTVGSPQIRNAATIGGNLATCSPAGDGLPVLAALDAVVELLGADGTRTMPVAEFMAGVKRTRSSAGRADHRGHGAAARRLAGLRQGRRPQRDGDRHRRRLPRRRRARPHRCASRSGRSRPTIVRAPDAEAFAAGAVDWDAGTVSRRRGRRVRRARGRRQPADRRPPLHRGVPPPRRRGAGRAGSLRRAFPGGQS